MSAELSWVTRSQVSEFGLIKSATITLTDDQIKASPITPIVIVPATETLNFSGFPAMLPKIISAFFVLDATAGAYSGDLDTLLLIYGSDGSGSNVGVTRKIDANGNASGVGLTNEAIKQMASFTIGEDNVSSDGFLDNAVSLLMHGGGTISDGDPANTMDVTVHYIIVDVN